MIILETVGEEDADHVLDLLLGHEVQLELVKEEVGDEFEHLGALVIPGEPVSIVVHQCPQCVPLVPVVSVLHSHWSRSNHIMHSLVPFAIKNQ